MDADPRGNDNWHVLVFEGVGGYRGRGLTQVIPIGPDRYEAVAHASKLAAEYRPTRPMLPRSRQVFQTSADSWTVNLDGAATSYYFTVRVARLVFEQ